MLEHSTHFTIGGKSWLHRSQSYMRAHREVNGASAEHKLRKNLLATMHKSLLPMSITGRHRYIKEY